MADTFPDISERHKTFIEEQPMFFVGSAATDGHVNLSPKGGDALRVMGPNRIIWRNLTGSGNETAGHLAVVNRMTIMWCSFTLKPLILRCYGTAKTVHVGDRDWDELNAHFPDHIGARQIYDMEVSLVQGSCGYAVPKMTLETQRDTLDRWAVDKGPDGIAAYWRDRNQKTIDGLPTGIPTE